MSRDTKGRAKSACSELSEEQLEEVRETRFRERVGRVLAVMREERIDWRGLPMVTPDGRIMVRVVPVELGEP